MTSKEKAEELINKFMNLNLEKIKLADYSKIYYPTAKQCALIAVDEILEVTGGHINQFYKQVKTELSNL